ncbi:YjjG family noncanonical pyrimidine nucleotidase [Vagococcus sp.]|uniref:YjjG family noncanonical pyrimidine nucleotidase n=1 Tax=Vagococcus sp. TaxID=1933889 RepID=UPI000EC0435B|nr:YjjG family noncanonical pyrimidine nucleotidase [Vagococcus sp.]HCT96349.1 noncanonical pyrimidine nucleotidase, YjjG family [Vagococcus sp.]
MRYDVLLIDVDDTLLNFKEAEVYALNRLFEQEGIVLTEEIQQDFTAHNHALWGALEKNLLTREEVLAGRFDYIFKKYGQGQDGKQMDRYFRQFLSDKPFLMPGVAEVLPQLAANYDLYVVTNGVEKTQYQRLERADLLSYFNQLFVSETIGYQKPDRRFFDEVFAKITTVEKEKVLIIGDSLSADMQGGIQAGIDTCWYNPHSLENKTVATTYTVHSFEELKSLLN